jgi:hypothetical protein
MTPPKGGVLVKNRWHITWAGAAFLAALAFPGSLSAQMDDCLPTLDPDCRAEVRLLAGQYMDVGTIVMQRDAEEVCVTYMLNESALEAGWLIYETHLAIGTTKDDIPQTKGNKWGTNPIPGKFPYGECFRDGVVCWSVCFLLHDLGFVPGDTLYIAAHAVVGRFVRSERFKTETAWGEGERFNERGNWGMYIEFLECEVELVPSYIGYEDNNTGCDFDYNDFGMDFWGLETYEGGILRTIEMTFISRIYFAWYHHDIHIERYLDPLSVYTYDLFRDHAAAGHETMGGVGVAGSGLFDVVLFDTDPWTAPDMTARTVEITVHLADDLNTLADYGPAPRFDLCSRFSLYDPYMYNYDTGLDISIVNMKTAVSPLPAGGYTVPCILVIPQCCWPYPDEAETITGPYPEFYDYL